MMITIIAATRFLDMNMLTTIMNTHARITSRIMSYHQHRTHAHAHNNCEKGDIIIGIITINMIMVTSISLRAASV